MANEEQVYEQRQASLRPGGLEEYVKQARERVWPALIDHGAKVLCLVNGLIGLPPEEIIQATRFPDISAWSHWQSHSLSAAYGQLEHEEVRLLKAVTSRPKLHLPAEDKRAIYGYRRLFIRPADLNELVHDSEDGVWPRIESQGARVLGLWTTLASTDPLEVVLMTGYHGPAHWEETRVTRPKPEDVGSDLWEGDLKLRARREQITIKTWVCLMRAIDVYPLE